MIHYQRPLIFSLPPELLQHIAYLLISSSSPLGPPSQIIPFFLTCRTLYACLQAPAFLAKVFRFKFDAGAVERRAFKPSLEGMKEMLEVWCRTLAFVKVFARRKGNYLDDQEGSDSSEPWDMDLEMHLHNCLFMMLDNDGKNYAQLKHAGVHIFVDHYVRYCIWDPSIPYPPSQKSPQPPTQYGWPIDTPTSSAAVLLYWLTLERTALLAMPVPRREELVRVLLPFVVMPFRYPATEAPPNHFELPLVLDGSNKHQEPLAFYLPGVVENALSAGESTTPPAPLPSYPHYPAPNSRALYPVYFLSRPQLTIPPTALGAKLLFVALREVRRLMVPPILPPGLRREDYAVLGADFGPGAGDTAATTVAQSTTSSTTTTERPRPKMKFADRGKAARLPRGACWDWEKGVAVVVNPDYVPDIPSPPAPSPSPASASSSSSSSTPSSTSSSSWSPTPPSQGEIAAAAAAEHDDGLIIPFADPESKKWDPTYWRMRLCGDLAEPRPIFNPGEVYVAGSIGGGGGKDKDKGSWVGKIYIPQGIQYNHLLTRTPTYPGPGQNPPPFFGHDLNEGGFQETGFSEASLGLVMQHVFVDLQEHVRVCVCGGRGRVRAGGAGGGGGGGECDACGSIPLPPLVPRVWEEQEQLGEEERLEGGGRRRAGQQQQREGGRPGRRRRGRRQHQQQQQRLGELEQEGRRDQTAAPPPPVVLEEQQDQHEQQQDDQAPVPIQVEAIDAEFEALGDVNVNAQGANVRGPAPPQEVRRMTALAQRGVVVVDGRAGRSRERERISERGEGTGQVVGVVGAGVVDANVNPNVPDPENLHGQEDDDEEELEEDYEGEDSEGEGVVPLPSLIDMSMCNAWFPGPIGGVKWVERDSIPVVNGRVNERGDEKEKGSIVERELDDSHEGDNEKKKQHHQERRREIVFNSGFEEPDAMKEDVCVRVREAALGLSPGSSASFMSSSSSTLSASDPFNDTAKAVLADMMKKKENNYTMRDGWVYETWDKDKVSVHDLGATATASSSSCHPAHVDSQENDAAKSKFNPHCATCVAFEQARREQRTREASKARKVLDRVMRRLGAGAGYQGMRMGVDSSEEGEEERGVNEDVDMEDLDMDSMAGFDKALEGVVRDAVKLGGGRGGMHVEDEDEEDRMEVDEGSVRVVYEDVVEDDDDDEEEEEQEEEEGYALAPPSSSPRDGNGRGRVEVFGDDESIDERGYWVHQTTTKRAKSSSKSGYSRASNGSAKTSTTPSSSSSSATDDERGQTLRPQSNSTSASSSSSSSTTPPFTATTTSKYIQPIRRSYSRSRIGAGCNGGVGDIVVTGETATGDAYRTWQAPARFYGRVRKWDGLVGILRCATVPPINYIFIFGYIVGENNFVGEWRVAGADPLRPVWGSAFVMSRRES